MLVTVFNYVVMAFIIVKAGEPWWKVLVPYYNGYTMYKVAKRRGLFWLNLALSLVFAVCYTVFSFSAAGLMIASLPASFLSYSDDDLYETVREAVEQITPFLIREIPVLAVIAVSWIALFITECVYKISLGRAFGKPVGFGIGLIFLPLIFMAILAFDRSEHVDRAAPPEEDTGEGYYTPGGE